MEVTKKQYSQDIAYCCPRCHSDVLPENGGIILCANKDCIYCSGDGFPVLGGQPALIDFERSVIERSRLVVSAGQSAVERRQGALYHRLRKLMKGETKVTSDNADAFLRALGDRGPKVPRSDGPVVLMVGGGTVRSGARMLYDRNDIRLVSFDVYASELTDFIADGHAIPLPDGSVDGVWIEAVLEHVLEPHVVVAEIHRVLAPDGVVYAETPFMQQVHEGAYDFTRFTHSGHRWLFRRFQEIDSGAIAGVGTALIWSWRYFWYTLTGNRAAGIIATLPVFWLRYFDGSARKGGRIDAASGYYFLGRKVGEPLSSKAIVAYYRGQQ